MANLTKSYLFFLWKQLCTKICLASDFFCWFCSGIYGQENSEESGDLNLKTNLETNIETNMEAKLKTSLKANLDLHLDDLKLPTQADLIQKAKLSFRQQKIVGGLPSKYGDLPFIVRKVFLMFSFKDILIIFDVT